MSKSMLAAVHDAAGDNGEPEEKITARASAAKDKADADALGAAVTTAAKTAAAEATATATKAANANAAAIADMCIAAGVPAMASALIKEGLSAGDAEARVDGAKEIKAKVDIARKSCPSIAADQADRYITAGLTEEQVSADLFNKMSALQSPEIASSHQAGAAKAAGAGWDKAVAKVNSRVPAAAD